MEEANKLIGAGKKHLVMGKVVEAVSVLQEACGMLAKTYGDTADECGEAFFWCGKALLDLARMENSVLGNALEGVPEEEDEEKPKDSNVESTENIDEKTRDELRVQVYDAMAEKKSEDAAEEKKGEDKKKVKDEVVADEEKSEDVTEEKKSEDAGKEDGEKVEGKQCAEAEKNGDKEQVEAADEQESTKEEEKSKDNEGKSAENEDVKEKEDKEAADKPEEGKVSDREEEDGDDDDAEMEGETQEEGEGDGTAEKDSEEEEEEEEVGNLQLAWEMLEVAKVIYKRKETKDDQLMAAQAHLKLGEVSAESGNYAQALEDFQECLNLQVKNLDSDSRLLAETHYQLGLTYSLNLQYSEAIKEFNSSISVIKSRLDKLGELLDKAEGPEALPSERKEMEELKALLPEIQEKVEDATEGQKLTSAAPEAVKGVLGEGSTSSSFSDTTAQNGDSSSTSKINRTSTNGHAASTAPVSDISHLVRKKRKPEESPVKEGLVKKVKQDDDQTNREKEKEPPTDGVDTDGKETNGHANTMEVESQ